MNSEIVIAIKDSVKLNILQEVLSNNISLSFQLNNGNAENYSSQIHNEKSRVKVYGKFNISEDPTGEFLTIRPVAPDCKMAIKASVPVGVNGKKISVVRSSTREIEKEFEITPDVISIEFIPSGKQGYTLRVVYGDSYINQTVLEDTNSSSNVQANNTSSPLTDFATIPEIPSREENRFSNYSFTPENNGSGDDQFDTTPIQQFGVSDDRFADFNIDNNSVIFTTRTEPVNDVPQQTVVAMEANEANEANEVNVPKRASITEHTDPELERIEKEISVIECDQSRLSQKKQSAIEHLEKIEAEYKKDYASLEQELEEIKLRMDADASIIEHYKDKDVMPIEILFQEVNLKLEEAESQIRLFIEAKQRKTMEIEGEIKSNKKQ